VAKLADAQASGACIRKDVRVQVPPRPPSDLTVFLGRTNPQSVLLDSGEIMTKLISDRYLRVGDHLNLRSATIAAATPHIEITSKSCQVQGEVCAVA
jgi:hypothetical protein